MAALNLTPAEEAQLGQTIEMFEVIVQSQPNDCQSLEILKEAYSKLAREEDVINTSKRIAQAYMQQGQLSSAILEYETVLQRRPDDADVQAALKHIEDTANNVVVQSSGAEPAALMMASDTSMLQKSAQPSGSTTEVEDGKRSMIKIFVDSKVISMGDFDLCWRTPEPDYAPMEPMIPFIQSLHDKGILFTDKSLKLLADKTRTAFIPLDRYEVDLDLARGFPAALCRRWCVLPFDRMSKSVFVATANPFNQQAAKEISAATQLRLVWFLVEPPQLVSLVKRAFH